MIQEDAKRCLELDEKIKRLEAKIAEVAKNSKIAELYDRFLGLVPYVLQNWPARSAPSNGFPLREAFLCISACPRWTTGREVPGNQGAEEHVNTRAKAAMMIGVDQHRRYGQSRPRSARKERSGRKKAQPGGPSFRSAPGSDYLNLSNKNGSMRFVLKRGDTKAKVRPRLSLIPTGTRRPKLSAKKQNNKDQQSAQASSPLEILSGMFRPADQI